MTRKTLAERVCQLLADCRQNQPCMQAEARSRGVSLDQLLAAAIADMVFEMLDPTTDDAESEWQLEIAEACPVRPRQMPAKSHNFSATAGVSAKPISL